MILSIITINYNNAEGLKKTLASVAAQTVTEFEHVVVDGASTDGSAEIIREYAESAPYPVRWVSEPDKGIYNAMNKGLRMASGDYVQVLNSGDIYASEHVIADMFEAMRRCGDKANGEWPEFLFGNMIRRRPDGTVEGKSGRVEYSLRNYYTSTMNHDCCWIKRTLFLGDKAIRRCGDEDSSIGDWAMRRLGDEEANDNVNGKCESHCYGLYDENLKIVSDWKWFLSAIGLGHVKPVYVDIDVTIFDLTGISERNLQLRNEERRKVLEELVPPAILADYDKHAFDMAQMDKLRQHKWAYKLVWTLERILNRIDNRNFKIRR